MARMKTAVLVSGRGSNMQAIIEAAADPSYPAEIALVISNKQNAPALALAEAAGNAGVRFAGCTVHFVRPEMDTGPIIAQAVVPVHASDDADALAARILTQEHRIYPLAVQWIAEGRVRISGEVVRVQGVSPPEGALINPANP